MTQIPERRKQSGSRPVVTRIRARTKYSPSFCDNLIDMAAKGYSVLGFCGAIGICERTYYNWLGTHEEFSEAHSVANAVRVYGAESMLLTAGDSLSLNKAQTLLRAYGAKIWSPKDSKAGHSAWEHIDLSKLSDAALNELSAALLTPDASGPNL